MKEKIANSFLISLRVYAAAWLTYLASIIPLYIWRGIHPYNEVAEDILMSITGAIFGFLILMRIQMRAENAHHYSTKNTLLMAAGGIGIHMIAGLLLQIPFHNHYVIAVSGYHLARLIAVGSDSYPTFLGALISAFVFGAIYFAAILVGTKLAHKRYKQYKDGFKTK